jgi:hypothetical protein
MKKRRPSVAPGWMSILVSRRANQDSSAPDSAAGAPQPMRQALQQDGVHAGIGGQHFKAGTRGGVALEHAGDVFAQQREQAGGIGPFPRGRESSFVILRR